MAHGCKAQGQSALGKVGPTEVQVRGNNSNLPNQDDPLDILTWTPSFLSRVSLAEVSSYNPDGLAECKDVFRIFPFLLDALV